MGIQTNQERGDKVAKRAKYESWKPTDDPEIVQFFSGEYVSLLRTGSGNVERVSTPFFINYEAFLPGFGPRKRGIYVQCRCNDRLTNDPCVLHWRMYEDIKEKKEKGIIGKSIFSPSMRSAFNVLRLSYFHHVLESKTRVDGSKSNRTIMERCTEPGAEVDIANTTCKFCKEDIKRTFGQRRYFNVGQGHFNDLMRIERVISRTCKSCGGEIRTVRWTCPQCEERGEETILLDPMKTTLTDKEVRNFWKFPHSCAACGFNGEATEVIRCMKDCGAAESRSLFDIPVCIKKVDDDQYFSSIVAAPTSIPLEPIDYTQFDDEFQKMLEPYDFPRVLSVTTREQADRMDIEDPFAGEGGKGNMDAYRKELEGSSEAITY